MQTVFARLPLTTLLSQVLVAFTIEFDNESERRIAHRTTVGGETSGPWLVSMVMYLNLLQFIGEEGITVADLQQAACIQKLSLVGMQRWGYILIADNPRQSNRIVRTTAKGRAAQDVWRSLLEVLDTRWRERFGEAVIDNLRKSLESIIGRLEIDLPDYLPVLGYGLVSEVPARSATAPKPHRHLPSLLSKVLLAFALDFERESDLSLAVCANVMRLLDQEGIPTRDLPQLAGVSKESIQMALNFLESRRYVTVEPDPRVSRTKSVRLTAKGSDAKAVYPKRLTAIEDRWRAQFGNEDIQELRAALQQLIDQDLFRCLETYSNNWRAAIRKPAELPHFPMVLHRGGYPDGS